MDSFDRQFQRWFSEDRDRKSEGTTRGTRIGSIVLIVVGAVIALFILLSILKGFYTEWLWFSSLGYGSVYTTILKTKVLIFFIAASIFCVLFLGNLVLATHMVPKTEAHFWPWTIARQLQSMLMWGVILGTIILSLIFGMIVQSNWEMILLYLNWQPFGIPDPVFFKEIGFYVYSLPFLGLLKGWLQGALIVSLIGSAGVYVLSYGVQRMKFDFSRRVLAHLGGLLIIILGLFAWGYWLGIWELVFSSQGVVFGASYTNMHAGLPAQWILLVVVAIIAVIVLISIWRRSYRLPLYGVGAWIVAAIVVSAIYPAIVQRFQVQPNELVREMPYIEYNIEFTREAFALNRVEEKPFLAEDTPTPQDIVENEVTISNIRLWDHRPLKDTYNHIQSLRQYYDFNDVDVDRYTIDGEYRQVMLSARELSIDRLTSEAQTWLNQRLVYTHGYGLTLSPVNEVEAEGLPALLIKDIPPVGDIAIEQPAIYYGEKTNDYVVVKTENQEFDYPSGDDNVYGSYRGTGGVSLDGFIRRLAYAWQLGDFNILISGALTPESRVLYHRDIQERVNHLAPFLKLDNDPYLVIMDGRLFWIQDAYTTTDRYPYSTPLSNGLNYIRNSVKAVIDAYNGDVTFYITDSEDALIRTYQAIFPDLFVSMEQMPETLRAHLRYPEDMFNVQAQVYLSYHMRDARVFYNKEDMWATPREVYFGSEQAMEPYYIIMRLPDEEKEEFLLMLPFTPANKKNTVGWLAARCDGENYGTLLAYNFPKELWVDGPSQIENLIGQDTVITEQLALWGRGGSQVIRGNLLLIPLGDSILYVEPVFLQAEGGGLPELKRVIVVAGEKIEMRPTLAESLEAVFGTEEPPTGPEVTPPEVEQPEEPEEPETPVSADIANLIEQAQQHFDKAQEYLSQGDWAGYGEELEALEAVLEQLAELTAGQ
ncbi:UPF0182 family protein [Chloroflexota bacterium]